MKVTMERLGVTPSFSRPRVSNDNPFSEARFRTCKYTPNWPTRSFATIEKARAWVQGFANWYNTEHRHSAIRFVTPDQRHRREDRALLASRHQVYALAPGRAAGAVVRPDTKLATHRLGLAQPGTTRRRARTPWGRRRAPP